MSVPGEEIKHERQKHYVIHAWNSKSQAQLWVFTSGSVIYSSSLSHLVLALWQWWADVMLTAFGKTKTNKFLTFKIDVLHTFTVCS